MADRKANFTEKGAKRIVDAVRNVENTDQTGLQSNLRTSAAISNLGKWAKLTSLYDGKYAWTAQEPQSDGTLADNADWGSGTTTVNYAVDANGGTDAELESVVFIRPAVNEPYWIFDQGAGEIIRFETDALKEPAVHVIGKKVIWNGTSYEQTEDHIGLVDSLGVFGRSKAGSGGWAVKMPDRATVTILAVDYPAYEIIYMESEARWIECTTTADMSSGSTTATVDNYWGHPSNGALPPLDTSALDIYDTQGLFGRSLDGAKALVVLDERNDQYNIVRCEVETTMYRGTASSAFDDGDSTVTVGSLVPLLAYPFSPSN